MNGITWQVVDIYSRHSTKRSSFWWHVLTTFEIGLLYTVLIFARKEELDMTVYADMIFLLNFCVDLLLLWLTMAVRNQRTAIWRLAAAAFLGACYAVMMLLPVWPWVYTWGMKLVFSFLMVWVAFGYRGRTVFVRNWGVFYFVSFVVGGGMFAAHYVLQEQAHVLNGILITQSNGMRPYPITWMFIAVAFPLVWWYSRVTFRSLAERQTIHRFLVQVEVILGKESVSGTGLIDTGNQLRDPLTRVPVMIVEQRLLMPLLPVEIQQAVDHPDVTEALSQLPLEWVTRVKLIPFRSITRGTDFLLAIKPDKIRVVYERKAHDIHNVLIGMDSGILSADGTYQMIIHPSFIEEAS